MSKDLDKPVFTSKKLKTGIEVNPDNVDKIIGEAKDRIVEDTCSACGKLRFECEGQILPITFSNTHVFVEAGEPPKAKVIRQEVYAWLESIIKRPLTDPEHFRLSNFLQRLAAAKAATIRQQLLVLEQANIARKNKARMKQALRQGRK